MNNPTAGPLPTEIIQLNPTPQGPGPFPSDGNPPNISEPEPNLEAPHEWDLKLSDFDPEVLKTAMAGVSDLLARRDEIDSRIKENASLLQAATDEVNRIRGINDISEAAVAKLGVKGAQIPLLQDRAYQLANELWALGNKILTPLGKLLDQGYLLGSLLLHGQVAEANPEGANAFGPWSGNEITDKLFAFQAQGFKKSYVGQGANGAAIYKVPTIKDIFVFAADSIATVSLFLSEYDRLKTAFGGVIPIRIHGIAVIHGNFATPVKTPVSSYPERMFSSDESLAHGIKWCGNGFYPGEIMPAVRIACEIAPA